MIAAYIGIRRSPSEYDKFLNKFKKITEFPPSFKKLPSVLYRVLVLSDTTVKKILDGKIFSMKPRALTSWSPDFSHAQYYAIVMMRHSDNKSAIILKINPKSSDLLFNISNAQTKHFKILEKYFDKFNEKEVVLKGNGSHNIFL